MRWFPALWCLLGCVSAVLLCWQALTNAPTSDEAAHLVAGIATVRTGEPGFYRVNPPLHKVISGAAIEVLSPPELPHVYRASLFTPGSRFEFDLAAQFLLLHANDYPRFFYIGRLIRIPLILLTGWLLLSGLGKPLRVPSLIASSLWLTSPLVLGLGWSVMPDVLAGCAAVLLLVSTLQWLRRRSWLNYLLVGLAWGIAIGTKFTFIWGTD